MMIAQNNHEYQLWKKHSDYLSDCMCSMFTTPFVHQNLHFFQSMFPSGLLPTDP